MSIRALFCVSLLTGVLSVSANAQQPSASSVELMTQVGGAYRCARLPKFLNQTGLSMPVAIDTSLSLKPGVVIRELTGSNRVYQPDEWKVTGHVGSTVRDSQGNIYIVPIPSVALDTNPLSKRNTVYRISSDKGEISVFAALPLPAETSQQNPFGVVGLAIDCDTNSLYVSSLAGSTPKEALGTIYQLDLGTGKVIDTIVGIDALGVSVFNHSEGKRLYYGDARSSSLYSLSLRENGRFSKPQSPRYELSLLEFKNGDSTQIRKIRITKNKHGQHIMTLDDSEFAYRLAAETTRRYKKYSLVLNPKTEQWQLASIRSK